MTVRFPIAADADAALKGPLGRAAREREAAAMAGAEVEFVREAAGPAFAARDAAEAAYAGLIDVAGSVIQPEDRFCDLIEVAEGRGKGGQAEPVCRDGRRWPKAPSPMKTVWRLSVGYWRLVDHSKRPDLPQARAARRRDEAQKLDAASLRAMAQQPLQAVKPQQPLDIGLFEVRLPESPDIIVPDE